MIAVPIHTLGVYVDRSNPHPAVCGQGLPNSTSGAKNVRNTGHFHYPSVDVTVTPVTLPNFTG